MIKLIVSDLDGTMLNDDHVTIPPSNIAALAKAQNQGIKIAVATGRTYSISGHIIKQLPCNYLIFSNGAAALDLETGKTIYSAGIPYTDGEKILRRLSKTECVYSVVCANNVYMEKHHLDEFQKVINNGAFMEFLLPKMNLVSNIFDAINEREIEKIEAFNLEDREKQHFKEYVLSLAPWNFSSSYNGSNIEITAPDATKGKALVELCRLLDISKNEVMAFGDSDNDIDMLSWASHSFAMENAIPSVKAAAANGAGRNEAGGVGKAVEDYLEKNLRQRYTALQ
ncbi:MAG: Cof-type HAD-IIB family hydrolase [Spirochaetaceae bacterium]|jgi:Cof subfamily protein (haloacid dehalogenase superfamily)|nr:Cof-type HAD-IIB family hydrolase [Spirochaetaceae bacterium]